MACVIVHDRETFDPAALIKFLEADMPRFMLPRYVEVLDDFPRNETTVACASTSSATGASPTPPGTAKRRAEESSRFVERVASRRAVGEGDDAGLDVGVGHLDG